VGGLGHPWGPAFGAAVLYLISTWLNATFGSTTIYIAIVGVLVALIVLFLPDGIVGLLPQTRRLKLVRKLLFGMVPSARQDRL
jgi:branched-chain amino acid transport system permease protein